MNAPGHPQKGDVIAGKYQVEDVLGAGGMGVVVAARHLALRQRVAVKFLLANAPRLPDAVERFLREARAAVAIQSEHVARVLDVGTLEDGAPYMVMEYLAGTDFARLIRQRGALPIDEALDFVLQASEAIAEAHALGIVHRDLKPSNLFLTKRAEGSPLVKVLDFGLSKMAAQEGDAPESSLTATGFVAGSPQYMSPEQVRSLRNVDWRTDIWALGVILYEVLTARRPFEGPSLTAVCASIVADTPLPMRELRPEIPEGLEAAVMRCLEKDPRRRLRSVAELAEALAPFAPARSQALVEHIGRLLPDSGTVQMPEVVPAVAPVAAVVTMMHEATVPLVRPPVPAAPPAPSVESEAPLEAPEVPTTGHSGTWGQTGAVSRGAPSTWIAGGAAVVVVVVVAAVGAWLRSSPARVEAVASAPSVPVVMTASAPAVAVASAPVVTAVQLVEVPPLPVPAPPTASSSVAPAATLQPKSVPSPTFAPAPTPKSTPPKPGPPKATAPKLPDLNNPR